MLATTGLSGHKERLLRCADTTPFFLQQHYYVIRHSSYFLNELVVKNCTVTLRPIGNDRVLSSKPITASRISRSLLSDGSPVEMLFLPIIADILTRSEERGVGQEV